MTGLPSIYFRTDGNTEIATGHIMRCLTIARACIKNGACVAFIVSDEESRTLLRERFIIPDEFAIHCLHSDYHRMYEELPALISYLDTETNPDDSISDSTSDRPWLFIDSYYATPAYFTSLHPYVRIAYLDDLRSMPCDVDLVINYDTEADCTYYTNAKHKLLGPGYTPLREQFIQPVYTVRPSVQNILLSTGGTDPYGVAEHLLQKIFDIPDESCRSLQTCDYHIVTSKANARFAILSSMAAANPHIHIHENVSDMASLMASCDLAVSAGGTTLCELCAVGVPTVSYLMAENQRTAVETFAGKGLIPFAGDIRGKNSSFKETDSTTEELPILNNSALSAILSFLTQLSHNADIRKKSSRSMRAFLDGRGAVRIAEAMLKP